MRRLYVVLILSILVYKGTSLSAQSLPMDKKEGSKIVFNIKNAPDRIIYLVVQYRDKYYIKDSATAAMQGKYIFTSEKHYDDGLYSLVSEKHVPYMSFMIDHNYHFEYNLDTSGLPHHFSVKNSPENQIMLDFQKKSFLAQENMKKYQDKLKTYKEPEIKDSVLFYENKIRSVNDTMVAYIQRLITQKPEYLFTKLQKAYQQIEIPHFYKADSSADEMQQLLYYREHFWDHIDLGDHRILYLPVTEGKYQDFRKMYNYQETDTITKYVTQFLNKITDTVLFHYFLDRLTYDFESSKILGHDAVFVYLAKKYQLKGKAYWMEESLIEKYRKRVNRLEPLLIGKRSQELIMSDTTAEKSYSTYHLGKKYVIIWFYDPTCQTCKRETAKLVHLYDSLKQAGSLNFEVYGVGNDGDTQRWIKYVRDNKLPWINVGGRVANIDYLDVYNIHETGNPTMFIINEKKDIILNKRIEIMNIPGFLEEYERIQKDKK
jgi:hypothetical protein